MIFLCYNFFFIIFLIIISLLKWMLILLNFVKLCIMTIVVFINFLNHMIIDLNNQMTNRNEKNLHR